MLAPVVAAVLLAAVLAGRHDELVAAFAATPAPPLLAATLLHALTLALRAEAWQVALSAVDGRRLRRRAVHQANAWAFLAGSALGHLTLPARVAAVRRLAPDEAPCSTQVALAEVPIFAVDAVCTAVAIALALGGPAGWIAAGLIAAVVAAPARKRAWTGGLAVLADPRARALLAALLAAQVALTLARVALLLAAFGLPHAFADTGLLLGAMTLAGLLPIGPASGPVATLAAVGAGAATAAAVGLALAATSIGGTLAYAGGVGVLTVCLRARRAGPLGSVRWRLQPPSA
jgi:hypothetical protein